mmetsp:Transcript_8304/g.17309  ORF Transcript_8304/g.17309 Transcript_8304/m.17309 type:complete len:208 (+) Transcript_8304:1776-2399(+)
MSPNNAILPISFKSAPLKSIKTWSWLLLKKWVMWCKWWVPYWIRRTRIKRELQVAFPRKMVLLRKMETKRMMTMMTTALMTFWKTLKRLSKIKAFGRFCLHKLSISIYPLLYSTGLQLLPVVFFLVYFLAVPCKCCNGRALASSHFCNFSAGGGRSNGRGPVLAGFFLGSFLGIVKVGKVVVAAVVSAISGENCAGSTALVLPSVES